jgi:hypothetical protein
MISDDVCSPLSLGEGWGEAPIKVSALPRSSSARKRETPPILPSMGGVSDIAENNSELTSAPTGVELRFIIQN